MKLSRTGRVLMLSKRNWTVAVVAKCARRPQGHRAKLPAPASIVRPPSSRNMSVFQARRTVMTLTLAVRTADRQLLADGCPSAPHWETPIRSSPETAGKSAICELIAIELQQPETAQHQVFRPMRSLPGLA